MSIGVVGTSRYRPIFLLSLLTMERGFDLSYFSPLLSIPRSALPRTVIHMYVHPLLSLYVLKPHVKWCMID